MFGQTQLLRTDVLRCTARISKSWGYPPNKHLIILLIASYCDFGGPWQKNQCNWGSIQGHAPKRHIESSRAQWHNIFALVQHRTSWQLFASQGKAQQDSDLVQKLCRSLADTAQMCKDNISEAGGKTWENSTHTCHILPHLPRSQLQNSKTHLTVCKWSSSSHERAYIKVISSLDMSFHHTSWRKLSLCLIFWVSCSFLVKPCGTRSYSHSHSLGSAPVVSELSPSSRQGHNSRCVVLAMTMQHLLTLESREY